MRTTKSHSDRPPLVAGAERGNGRIATAFIVLAMAGVPLAIAPGLSLEYEVLPKLLILLAATAGLLFCWNAWYSGAAALLATKRGRWLAGALGALAASAAISTLLSARPELALAGSPARRYGLVIQAAMALFAFLAASCLVGHPRRLRVVLAAVACVSGVISLYAIAQYARWDPLLPVKLYTIQYEGNMVRIPGTLGHAVHLASFLAGALLLTYGLAAGSTGKAGILLRGTMLVMLIAIVLSGTRSAVLALVVGGAMVAFSGRRVSLRRIAQWAAGGAILALLIAGFLQLEIGTSLHLRLRQWRQDFYGGPRLTVWRDSLPLTVIHPIFGSGPETFGSEFRRRQSVDLSRAYPDFFQESPHNVPLAVTIEQGFFGLLALTFLMLAFVPAPSPAENIRVAAIRASGVCTFVCLLFIPLTIPGALMLYTAAALLTAAGSGPTTAATVQPGAGVKIVASAVAALLVLAAGAYFLQDAEYMRIAGAAKSGDVGEMARAFEAIASMSFPGTGDDLWASREFAEAARSGSAAVAGPAWKMAAAASARAERSGDNVADAAYQSALLALAANDPAQGERKLRQSIEAAPNWYKPHLLMAQLLRFTGRQELAAAESQRALELSGSLRPEVEKALQPRN